MTDRPCLEGRAGLRDCLIAMRAELGEQLTRYGIEGGALALLAGVKAAIVACDLAAERPADMVATGRAVMSDDGAAITLTLYTEEGAVAAIALDPVRAVGRTARLIATALPRRDAP